MRHPTSIVAVGLLAMVLAACTATTVVAPESPSVSAHSPSATAAALPTVVIAGDGVQVIAPDGTITGQFGWYDSGASSVATLRSAFGSAPTTRVFGASEPLPRTEYTWGDFTLQVDSDPSFGSLVHAHSKRVDGVEIRAVNGLTVGASRAEVVAADPDPSSTDTGLNFDATDVNGQTCFVSLTVTGDKVTGIDAPTHLGGGD